MQLAQDSSNLDDLVTSLQDSDDDGSTGCAEHFLSHCLFSGVEDESQGSKPGISLSFLYRELERLASAREPVGIPMLVQTRAQKGELPLVQDAKKRKNNPRVDGDGKMDAVTVKQRQSPLSSWIGNKATSRAEDS